MKSAASRVQVLGATVASSGAETAPHSAPVMHAGGARFLGGLGAAMAAVGWIDVGLNFIPLQAGNPDWEFGTASVVFDSLPLGTIGMGLLLFVAAGQVGRRWSLLLLGTACYVILLGLIGVLTLYGLALPAVWRAAGEALQGPLVLAIGKTSVIACIYMLLYAWMGTVAWRSARSVKRVS